MKNLWYNVLLVCSVFLTGCTGFLDVVPEDDIETIDSDFEKRENAEVWLLSLIHILETRLREIERKKKVSRRWLYIGNSVAAVAVLFFIVMTMLPEEKQIEKDMPVFRVAEIKVPT